jgi:hypothetical protein
MLVGLAVVVGLTAGCGGAVSNKGTENGDAGAQDATSASSTSDTSAPTPDAGSDGPGGSSVACVGPSDCPMQNGLQVYCCVDKTCIFGQAAESTSCADPDAEVLQASKYDQSCTTDADCVGVAEGNFCQPNPGCPNAAINKTALPRYMSDVGETYGGGSCTALSSCGLYYGPCCRQGMCQMNTGCDAKPSDTLPACAEAGGACGTFVTSCGVRDAGPSDSCAYPDEMCCLP